MPNHVGRTFTHPAHGPCIVLKPTGSHALFRTADGSVYSCSFERLEELMPDEPELKPCPFCGSKRVYIDHNVYFMATCQDCISDGPLGYTREQAVERWNQRKEVA